jgi:U3 small nucleolar RNA-associated protein 10
MASDQLQFLDWGDFQRYMQVLVDQGGYLANDVNYLPAFHQQLLTKRKSDSKKDSGWVQTPSLVDNFVDGILRFKHRVICYLVSHAVACPLPQVRASILMSLKDVPDTSKASMLIPVFKQSFETSKIVAIPATADEAFFVAIAYAFDKNAAKALNNKEGELWQFFVELLRARLTQGKHRAVSEHQPH